MRRLRSRAAYRIAFANFAAYAIGLALLGTVLFAVMHVAFTRQLDSMVSDEASALADEYRTGGSGELREAIRQRETSASSTRMLYGLFGANGRRIEGSLRARRPPAGLHRITFQDAREGPDFGRAMGIDLGSGTRLVVAVDSDWVERLDRIVLMVFGAAFLGACLLGSGGAVILGGYLERRLRSISGSAEAIIRGDIRQRMPVSPRGDEFDQVALSLNRMLDRIEGLLDNLRQVSSDIAHDLRTPLTRLRTRLEKAALEGPAAAGAVVQESIQQVDEVLSLFGAILRIAEVEAGETRRFFAPVDLSPLAVELAESFALSFEDQGRALLWSIEEQLQVAGDRELLAQAIINLLENAQRHTPLGSVTRLTLVRSGERLCVQVVDNGEGVPKAELGRITRRFTRLESARGTAGYGLGLSLVSAIAKLHGGQLLLRNVEPGLSVTIELPRLVNPPSSPSISKEPAQ